jgi:hypothetical protein
MEVRSQKSGVRRAEAALLNLLVGTVPDIEYRSGMAGFGAKEYEAKEHNLPLVR